VRVREVRAAERHEVGAPPATIALTWSASVMLPTAIVGTSASLRTRSLSGVWNARPTSGRASGEVWPAETWMTSAPASRNARAISTPSSTSTPPGSQSVAAMQTDIGRSAGHASRTAANTSSGSAADSRASPRTRRRGGC
jgi:hypothetical protein